MIRSAIGWHQRSIRWGVIAVFFNLNGMMTQELSVNVASTLRIDTYNTLTPDANCYSVNFSVVKMHLVYILLAMSYFVGFAVVDAF